MGWCQTLSIATQTRWLTVTRIRSVAPCQARPVVPKPSPRAWRVQRPVWIEWSNPSPESKADHEHTWRTNPDIQNARFPFGSLVLSVQTGSRGFLDLAQQLLWAQIFAIRSQIGAVHGRSFHVIRWLQDVHLKYIEVSCSMMVWTEPPKRKDWENSNILPSHPAVTPTSYCSHIMYSWLCESDKMQFKCL